MMFDKLARLCRHLTYLISVENNVTSKYILARDRAYFAVICHSGGRGGDIGLLISSRLFHLPDNNGILVSQIVGKTIFHPILHVSDP